jgi:endonuclease YncB( thermonuclease family)
MPISDLPLAKAAFIAVAFLSCQALGAELSGQASVVDGNTIDIRGTRIRLAGVDAPEGAQVCREAGKPWRCGQYAGLALTDFLGRRVVRCQGWEQDGYDRLVAICTLGDQDIGAWLVMNGLALADRQSPENYIRHEELAAGQRKGLWSGQFDMPWDWRNGQRSVETSTEQ